MKRLLATLKEKWPEYLLEVIVLIVGIYGAFALENWNEQRNQRSLEKEILIELRKSIKNSEEHLDWAIQGNESSIASIKKILDHMQGDAPYHDSLSWHFENAIIWWKGAMELSGYERAKRYGLHFIKSDELRSSLSWLYETNHNFGEVLSKREEDYVYNTAMPLLTQRFESTEIALTSDFIRGAHVPFDYDALKLDTEYRSILNTFHGNKLKSIQWLKMGKENMNQVNKLIDEEIKKY